MIARSNRMLLAFILASSVPLAAQEPAPSPTTLQATRSSLEELLSQYEVAARSQAYSDQLRAQAREEAARLRLRLQTGDFRIGDRIILSVVGLTETVDTLIVSPGPVVEVPTIGPVPLVGVLRSELEARLTEYLARYINDPVVHAESFVRLSFYGEVTQPGFHLLPPYMPLPDAIMAVGGPTTRSDLSKVRIFRNGEVLVATDEVDEAFRDGRTLDDLKLQAGDQVVVPTRPLFSAAAILRSLSVVAAGIFAVQRILR